MTHARTFLYWLKTHRCAGAQRIKDLLDNVPTFENVNLQYVYLFKENAEQNRVTAMVSDPSLYYLIDNESVWSHESPLELMKVVPEELVKYLDIKTSVQISANLSKKDKQALDGVLPLDFARATHTEQIDLWKRYIDQKLSDSSSVLDLSGLYTLNPRIIIEAGKRYEQFSTILLNQNNVLCDSSFNWLFYFPKLETVSIWYINDLTDKSLTNIHKYAPNLKIIEFHQCINVTGRCLISLSLTALEKIIIDNERCKIQDTTFETVITDDEWASIKSDTVNTLFINSGNLTLDFIDFCLKSFKSLTNFAMHELVLQKLDKNSRSGHTEHKINFHNASDINQGFYRYADVKVMDLVRNKIAPAFSESMLRKIREIDPSKCELIDNMLK